MNVLGEVSRVWFATPRPCSCFVPRPGHEESTPLSASICSGPAGHEKEAEKIATDQIDFLRRLGLLTP